MTPEEKAQKLAAWLQSPPGTPPPEDLDPEVLGAVVTLRPERAPAPRVSLDDILGAVESGPFKQAEVIPFAPKRSNLPRWVLAMGSSGLLAAAAVGLLILPLTKDALAPKSELAPESPSMAAAPAARAPAEPPGAGEAPAPPPPPPGGAPADAPATIVAEATAQPDQLKDAAPSPQKPPEAEDKPALGQSVADGSLAPAPAATPSTVAPARRFEADEGGLAKEERTREAEPIPEAAKADAPMSEQDRLIAMGYVDDAVAPAEKQTKTATTGAVGGVAPSVNQAAPAAPAASAGYAERASAKTKSEAKKAPAADMEDASSQGASARDAAVPTDYNAAWYLKYADVTAAYNKGDYRSLLNDSREEVAMDAAWRAATAAYRSGDLVTARTLVDQGLRKGNANTVFRAELLLLRGDIQAASGDNARAQTSWDEAARLNRAR